MYTDTRVTEGIESESSKLNETPEMQIRSFYLFSLNATEMAPPYEFSNQMINQ